MHDSNGASRVIAVLFGIETPGLATGVEERGKPAAALAKRPRVLYPGRSANTRNGGARPQFPARRADTQAMEHPSEPGAPSVRSAETMLDVIVPARNAEGTITGVLRGLQAQRLPPGTEMKIVVVDDDSTDATAKRARKATGDGLRLLRHERRQGRALTRNAGAEAGSGATLVFLDSDCVLRERDAIAAHLWALENGADLSVSPVRSEGRDFWSRYQRRAAQRQERDFRRHGGWVLTSACFALRRSTFEVLGGFDLRFTHYGFEDRDLFLRAEKSGHRIVLTERAAVLHEAPLSVSEITTKMRIAARFSAPLIRAAHPEAYRRLPYARIDAALRSRLALPLAALACVLAAPAARCWDRVVHWRLLPFGARAGGVRTIGALAYLCGSTRRKPAAGRGEASRSAV